MELERVPLWRGDHVAIKQLAEDFGRYLYLARLKDSQVLSAAIHDGLGLLLWNTESFAYADRFDEAAGRYRGLRCGQQISVSLEGSGGPLVKPEIALKQQAAESTTPAAGPAQGGLVAASPATEAGETAGGKAGSAASARIAKRFHGTVTLNSTRVGRDAGRIADEVIAHLAGLVGSEVTVTLEITAKIPTGAPENVVRTVTENSRTLKFTSQGFEEE